MIEDDVVLTLLEEITDLPVMARVRDALSNRRVLGTERYGIPLMFSTKLSGYKDLEEEILDAIIYARHCGRMDICRKLIQVYNDL